ncbi:hypothetical protein [Sphingomonas sp.]|uniref:hypothetical protein n=1 Tax=Sphingomonas sp. TaxID=28214 RepID=UPI000DB8EC28|nr:hypothetical protein [Sphingomonas sp.]PZU09807.1 MAG: hypothetical protein DI605_09265 [Sphingomonas sp.]
MKKTITILSFTLAAAGLSACSKSPEQNVTTENVSNSVDEALDNIEEIAPNASDASGIENVSNATS